MKLEHRMRVARRSPDLVKAEQLLVDENDWRLRMRQWRHATDRKAGARLDEIGVGTANLADQRGHPLFIHAPVAAGDDQHRHVVVLAAKDDALGNLAHANGQRIGGLFDVASKAKMPNRGEDFGQTLAVWGWQRSRYLELPLLGPRTVRDMVGLVGDSRLRPAQYIEDDATRASLQALQLVALRAKLLSIEGLMNQGAVDEYALFRDMWLQRRSYQINQTGQQQDAAPDEALPPYLMHDE